MTLIKQAIYCKHCGSTLQQTVVTRFNEFTGVRYQQTPEKKVCKNPDCPGAPKVELNSND